MTTQKLATLRIYYYPQAGEKECEMLPEPRDWVTSRKIKPWWIYSVGAGTRVDVSSRSQSRGRVTVVAEILPEAKKMQNCPGFSVSLVLYSPLAEPSQKPGGCSLPGPISLSLPQYRIRAKEGQGMDLRVNGCSTSTAPVLGVGKESPRSSSLRHQ